MLYVIHAIDFKVKESKEKRDTYYDAHRAYLTNVVEGGLNIVVAGPLVDLDGVSDIGSLFIVEAENIDGAWAFHKSDPFYIQGVFETSTVTGFLRRR